MNLKEWNKPARSSRLWIWFGLGSRQIRSGSYRYPEPVDVFNVCTTHLLELGEFYYATFWAKKCRKRKWFGWWAEMYVREGFFEIICWFPYSMSPVKAFEENRIEIPDVLEVIRYKEKKSITFHLSLEYGSSIAPCMDMLFRKLLACPSSYILCARVSLLIEG